MIAIALLLAPAAASAQDLSINALADVRLVHPSNQTSWMDGGLGKLRYGDGDPDLRLGQVLVDTSLRFGSDAQVFATVRHDREQQTVADVLEAYARLAATAPDGSRWALKLGAFFPPISMDNDGIGWTSPWTLTYSAINSWVGEELRTIGGEVTAEWPMAGGSFSLVGAVFGGNDPTGLLLAFRGWSLGDRPTGLFDHVRVPDDAARRARRSPPYFESEFLEMDDRAGAYGGFSWRDNRFGRLVYLHYDNLADPAARRFGQVAWRTRFDSLGIEAYLGDVALLGQAMAGETDFDPAPGRRYLTRFQSAYVLAAKSFGPWSAAARLDVFATQQAFGPNPDFSERGHALTLAATWAPTRWFQLTGEVLRLDSRRAQRNAVRLPQRAVETQLLLNARVIY